MGISFEVVKSSIQRWRVHDPLCASLDRDQFTIETGTLVPGSHPHSLRLQGAQLRTFANGLKRLKLELTLLVSSSHKSTDAPSNEMTESVAARRYCRQSTFFFYG